MIDATVGEPMTGLPETVRTELAGIARLVARHAPAKPAWLCSADGRPWPCPAARVHLRSQYADDQIGLSLYMGEQLMAAAVDLTDAGTPPPGLFHRFMGWT